MGERFQHRELDTRPFCSLAYEVLDAHKTAGRAPSLVCKAIDVSVNTAQTDIDIPSGFNVA